MSIKHKLGVPEDVAAIRSSISAFFKKPTEIGLAVGGYFGVYVFFDYDNEPIYVGQTHEGLSNRISRHLTNQRTDAVAMNVLDPFEVASIRVYPLFHKKLGLPSKETIREELDALEYSVFQHVLQASALGAVLNEKELLPSEFVELPKCYEERIIPDHLYQARKHPDIRIARRANTIARLAQVISERDVSAGLRRTLLTQAKRLEKLANERFQYFENQVPIAESGEETGDSEY